MLTHHSKWQSTSQASLHCTPSVRVQCDEIMFQHNPSFIRLSFLSIKSWVSEPFVIVWSKWSSSSSSLIAFKKPNREPHRRRLIHAAQVRLPSHRFQQIMPSKKNIFHFFFHFHNKRNIFILSVNATRVVNWIFIDYLVWNKLFNTISSGQLRWGCHKINFFDYN